MPASQFSQVVCIGVDVRHRRAQLAEQPDPLKPVESATVVPATATGVAGRSQEAEPFVVAQGAFGDNGTSGDVTDAPLSGVRAGHALHARTSRHVRSNICAGDLRRRGPERAAPAERRPVALGPRSSARGSQHHTIDAARN